MDLILDKINLRPVEQSEGNVQSEHIWKVRTRYIQSIKLQVNKTLGREWRETKTEMEEDKEVGREMKQNPRTHKKHQGKKNLFEKERNDQNTKSFRNIKKNKDQELMTCLNYLEVTGIYFERIISVMGQ